MARPKGVVETKPRNTAAKKMAAAIGANAVTPADMMLQVARHYWAKALDESGQIVREENAMLAFQAAEKAAPYFNARLANVTSTVTHKRDVSDYSREELLAIAARGSAGTPAEDGRSREPDRVH